MAFGRRLLAGRTPMLRIGYGWGRLRKFRASRECKAQAGLPASRSAMREPLANERADGAESAGKGGDHQEFEPSAGMQNVIGQHSASYSAETGECRTEPSIDVFHFSRPFPLRSRIVRHSGPALCDLAHSSVHGRQAAPDRVVFPAATHARQRLIGSSRQFIGGGRCCARSLEWQLCLPPPRQAPRRGP